MNILSLTVLFISTFVAILSVSLEIRKRMTERRKAQARLNKWFIKYSSEHTAQ